MVFYTVANEDILIEKLIGYFEFVCVVCAC